MDDPNSAKADWVKSTIERHERSLIRYATSITGDLERARDVVQDTFMRLCREEPERLDGHVTEWLFTVCRNRALDVQRKESRMVALTEMDLETRESPEPSPAVLAEQRESSSLVSDLLDALPVNQREVVRLKFQAGLSYQEISNVTRLSVGNVGFLLHTALKTLRLKMTAQNREQARRLT